MRTPAASEGQCLGENNLILVFGLLAILEKQPLRLLVASGLDNIVFSVSLTSI